MVRASASTEQGSPLSRLPQPNPRARRTPTAAKLTSNRTSFALLHRLAHPPHVVFRAGHVALDALPPLEPFRRLSLSVLLDGLDCHPLLLHRVLQPHALEGRIRRDRVIAED